MKTLLRHDPRVSADPARGGSAGDALVNEKGCAWYSDVVQNGNDDPSGDPMPVDSAPDAFDEFSFLPEQAQELGVPATRVTRTALTLPDGRTLSALRWDARGTADPQVTPDLTFLHGAGLNAHTWDRTLLALGLPALAIDLPGHGDSSWRDDAHYTPDALAEDVITALDAWTVRPQVLVGHSLGGLTAARVAALRPDLVRAVVLVDIAPGIRSGGGPAELRAFFAGPSDWASRDELVDRALSFGLGGSRQQAERGVFLNSRVRPDGRVEWKHHFAQLANRAANAPLEAEVPDADHAAVAAHATAEAWRDFTAIAAPVTLVYADAGYLVPEDVDQFRARLPHASVVTLASGHNVQEYVPQELAEVVRATAH